MNQVKVAEELETQLKDKLTQQMREAKDTARNEQIRLETQWKEAMVEKSEFEANNQILKEQLDNLKEAKVKDDEENATTIKTLRNSLQTLQNDHSSSKEHYEDKIKDV